MMNFKEVNTIVNEVVFNYSSYNYYRQKGEKVTAEKMRFMGDTVKVLAYRLGITISCGMTVDYYYAYIAYGYKDKYVVRWCTSCNKDVDRDTNNELKRHITCCPYPCYYVDGNNKLKEYEKR